MKKLIPILSLTLAIFMSGCGNTEPPVKKAYNEGINITPIPIELTQNEGIFTLSKKVTFVANDEAVEKVASYFAAKIKSSTGYELKIGKDKPASDYINLTLVSDIPVNEEGYLLEVTSSGIDIKAKTAQGLFYGMQTVMQLLPAEIESSELIKNIAWTMPAVTIKDEPRFKYRGQHIDVSRHFVDADFIKKQLDVMAMYKINKFHWHLTDDQGWRIEIKKYPKLTELGAKRTEGEGNVYGPYFYTQDQIKDVVAYAKERFIEVIPEIEMPGHGVAALTAYPEYSCTGGPFEVRNIWGVSNDVYCAGNDSTFAFLTDILEEVIPLFESPYIHLGGDECPKSRWKECPKCQARIKAEGLKADAKHTAEEKLQSYFIQRMEKVVLKHGKKMIGWDEILEGGLAPSATVMSWRGEEGGIAAANMNHDVIMTPVGWLYLNFYQSDPKISPVTIGGDIPLAKTYGYEPIPEVLSKDKQAHVLGTQGNVWTEYTYTPELIEWQNYPRILAVSEVAWSAKEKKDYKDFERRLDNQRVRLDMHNINYYIPMPEQVTPSANFVAFTDTAKLEFKTTEPVKMVYTTDGSEPNLKSAVYDKPLTFTENATLKIRSVLASEKMGDVRTITIEKQTYAPAVTKEKDAKPGLKAEHYKGVAHKVSEMIQTPTETEHIAAPQNAKYRVKDYRELMPEDYYNTVLTGYINIPEDGIYYFSTDVEEFWLDGKLFISNAGEVKRHSRNDKSIALAKGPHAIKIIRLSGIVGGWPPLWDAITLAIRNQKDSEFKVMDAAYFK